MRNVTVGVAGLICFGILVFVRPEVEDAGLFQSAEIKEWSNAQTIALIRNETDPLVEFLRAHPDSRYREDALMILEAMLIQDGAIAAVQEPEPEFVTRLAADPLGWGAIVSDIDLSITSLDALFEGQPTYAPVEGLPQSVWADQTCSDCHKFTAQTFCDQADIYTQASFSLEGRTQHPLGHDFTLQMREWAFEGCP